MISELDELKIQQAQLAKLKESVIDNPILSIQLDYRLSSINEQIHQLVKDESSLLPKIQIKKPLAAIFIKCQGVNEESGINSILAGNLLIEYSKMFSEQAIHDERIIVQSQDKKRRRKGSSRPELTLTSTPKGSFGFEFTPQNDSNLETINLHYESLKNLAKNIEKLSDADHEAFIQIVQEIPSGIITPLKRFFSYLSKYCSEIRFSFESENPITISHDKVNFINTRIEKVIIEETLSLVGIMRGVTLDTGKFDFNTEQETISGSVSDELSEEELARINGFTNHECEVILLMTIVKELNGNQRSPCYILMNAELKENNGSGVRLRRINI